jgi:transglutaminase-like putative cysteine protease
MKRIPPWAPPAFAAVATLVGIGGYLWLRRRETLQGGYLISDGDLGRSNDKIKVIDQLAPMPPKLQTTKAGGMAVTHYRAVGMPIEQRVRLIQEMVWKSVQDPRMRKLALEITRKCPERDGKCEARAIYNAVKKRVRYTGDVGVIKQGPDGPLEGVDFFPSAWRVWEFQGEDCDGHSILSSTLLALNGITPRLRVTTAPRSNDDSHIYTVAGLPKIEPTKWIAVDSTLPGNGNFGVEAPWGRAKDFKVQEFPA